MSLEDEENLVFAQTAEDILNRYDYDGDEELDRSEFEQFIYLTLCTQGNRMFKSFDELRSDDNFIKCYEYIDGDGSGGVDRDELIHFIKEYSGTLPESGEKK